MKGVRNSGDRWEREEDNDADSDDKADVELPSSTDGDSGFYSSSSDDGSSSFSGESSDTSSSCSDDGLDVERHNVEEKKKSSERQEQSSWDHDAKTMLVRKRRPACSSSTATENHHYSRDGSPRGRSHRRNRNEPSNSSHPLSRKLGRKQSGHSSLVSSSILRPCGQMARTRATTFLLLSALLWVYVQLQFVYLPPPSRTSNDDDHYSAFYAERLPRQMMLLSPEKREALRQKLRREAEAALGKAASNGLYGRSGRPLVDMTRHAKLDKVQEGCVELEWQKQTFPTCNNMHEIDLGVALHMKRKGPKLPDMGIGEETDGSTEEVQHQADKIGYLGSGLWRSVFKIDTWGGVSRLSATNQSGTEPAIGDKTAKSVFVGDPGVLKMMKMEHAVDRRNIDRHRRDALVMERLSSSPNVVSIYAYCGNTVLTEFSGVTLDRLLYSNLNSNDGGDEEGKEQPPASSTVKSNSWTRETPLGRVRLALGVFRGLADLHEVSGGPILHADITARQFLVDEVAGVLKLNDFNRCRFVTRKNDTMGEHCPVYIKDAPGANRSPEEYRGEALSDKIDVFSGAHILYRILTGKKPWQGHSRTTVKELIKEGRTPLIDQEYQVPGTSDAVLANLTLAAYEVDQLQRKNATAILHELEDLFSSIKDKEASL